MLFRLPFLRDDEPDHGTPPNPPSPAPTPDPVTHPPTAAPPPAATIVVTGTKSEREIELEGAVEREAARAKKAEIQVATLADENHRLKQAGLSVPKPKRQGPFGFEFED